MKRTLSALAISAVLLPLATGAVQADAADAAKQAPRLKVTGYAMSGVSEAAIRASAKAMTTVTVDGVSITADGTDVESPYPGLAAVRAKAVKYGLRTELLVSNYSNDLQDFDTGAAHALLSSPANIAHLATRMAGFVKAGRYDGVNIDLELVQKRDATGLVNLAKALQSAMPAKKTVSVDISAATSVAEYNDQGYALYALGRAVDVVQLMAYDQHGVGWSGPGPVGDLRWQKQALSVLLTKVPAGKVDLGQAGYGYAWIKGGGGTTVTDRGARARVKNDGAKAVWHPASGEWSATLSNGTRLWWADARSYAIRKKVAQNRHLHGLAVWVLGSSDALK